MNIRQIHQEIGRIQAKVALLGQRLEIADREAESHGSPRQRDAIRITRSIRAELQVHYTRLHWLQAQLPTAETLSEAAYNRALMLGLEVDAAEAVRRKTYHENRHLRLAA